MNHLDDTQPDIDPADRFNAKYEAWGQLADEINDSKDRPSLGPNGMDHLLAAGMIKTMERKGWPYEEMNLANYLSRFGSKEINIIRSMKPTASSFRLAVRELAIYYGPTPKFK